MRTPTSQPATTCSGPFIGSEGTLGVVTSITVKLLPRPAAVQTLVADFDSVEQAGDTVTAIIAAGIIPAAVEMMDTLAIEAVEAAVAAGYTRDIAAALIVELDGPAEEVASQLVEVEQLSRPRRHIHQARQLP